MIDPRRHVAPGQSLSLAAAQVNWINEQMRRSPAAAPRGGDFSAPYTWVYVRNSSGAAVTRWGILAITGVEIAPTYTTVADRATNQFQAMPLLTGGTPTVTTTAWCVTIEPIAAGKVGKAAVSGVVQCKVDVASEGHALVKCKASTAELQTDSSGEGLILWKDAGTGAGKWALVRLGDGGGGVRLGTISATWSKGSTATVTRQNGDGTAIAGSPTFTAKNYFATVVVPSGTKRVACALVDATWVLIAAEC